METPEFQEMNIMDNLKCDRIVSAINYLQTQNNMYYVYDFLTNLETHLSEKELSEEEILKIMKECCTALLLIHNKGLVHRNLTLKSFFIKGSKVILGKFL